MLVRLTLKILQDKIQQYMNQELSDLQAEFRRQGNQRSNCQYLLDRRKSKGIPGKHTPATLTMLKPLTGWITTNCGKFLKR